MTTAVQRRRGTSTEHASFTGLDGEITVNTTTYTIHVHDGTTVGGIVLAKADGSNISTSSIDINGGTIDGTVIGGSSAAAGTFTSITGTSANINGTVTADGLTVDGGSSEIKFSETTSSNASLVLQDATERLSKIQLDITSPNVSTDYYAQGKSSGWYGRHRFYTSANNTTAVNRMEIGSNGDISFYNTAGTSQSFFWDASAESLGIGTTSPSSTLQITSNTGNSSAKVAALSGTSATLEVSSDTYNQIVASGGGVLGINVSGSERMRIDSSGNLLVGTTDGTPYASNVKGAAFYNSGAISGSVDGLPAMYLNRKTSDGTIADFRKDGTTVGSISVTSSTTTYNITSDQRLKDNIVDAPAGNVDDIKVRSFDWKADGSHQEYGMVAQELEAVAPYAVTKGETEDDMWSVDYSKLVPMLIKEIQDLKAEVAALKGA